MDTLTRSATAGTDVEETRAYHLHRKFIKALADSTSESPVTLKALQKQAAPVPNGPQILEQFLAQLCAAKALRRSSGMQDGENYTCYWGTDTFSDVVTRLMAPTARPFTVAEKALIQKVHGFMPAQQLLGILNERLVCDLGQDAIPYTMEQLYTEIGNAAGGTPPGGHDWPSLRKLLRKAQRDGVLDAITEQTINDFAVVFSLNHKQALVLKDIILQAKEGV